jgi:glutathione S-transferase
MGKIMADITVYGFPHSSFVHIVQLVLNHKEVPYTFHDLEPDMGSPKHLALHPFDRVPILQEGDFILYETSAIAAYLEERLPTPRLYPDTIEGRALMNQWISAVNSYYYPYMIYHVGHERNVFPKLGIPSDEKVVAHALPKIEVGLQVMERQLSHGQEFLLGSSLTLADYYLLPSTYSFGRRDGQTMYASFPVVQAWRDRMETLPAVQRLREATADLPPIWHARKWPETHRPKY